MLSPLTAQVSTDKSHVRRDSYYQREQPHKRCKTMRNVSPIARLRAKNFFYRFDTGGAGSRHVYRFVSPGCRFNPF